MMVTFPLQENEIEDRVIASAVVTQYHFTSWPDHGVPQSSGPFLHLCQRLIQEQHREAAEKRHPDEVPRPIVVHCSAGVGRTGTLIAETMLLREVIDGNSSEVDVATVVKMLREKRPKMVQTFVSCSLGTSLRDRKMRGERVRKFLCLA